MKTSAGVAACLLATGLQAMVPEMTPTVTSSQITYPEPIRSVKVSELVAASQQYGASKTLVVKFAAGCELTHDADVPKILMPTAQGDLHLIGDGQPHTIGTLDTCYGSLYCEHVVLLLDDPTGPDSYYAASWNPEQFKDSHLLVRNLELNGNIAWSLPHAGTYWEICQVKVQPAWSFAAKCPVEVEQELVFDTPVSLSDSKPLTGLFPRLFGSGDLKLSGWRRMTMTINNIQDFTGRIMVSDNAVLSLPATESRMPLGAAVRLQKSGRYFYYAQVGALLDEGVSTPVEVVDPSLLSAIAKPYRAADGRLMLDHPYGYVPLPHYPVSYPLSKLESVSASQLPKLEEGDEIVVDHVPTKNLSLTATGKVTIRGTAREDISRITVSGGDVHYECVSLQLTDISAANTTLYADAERWKDCRLDMSQISAEVLEVDLNDFGNETSIVKLAACDHRLKGGVNGEIDIKPALEFAWRWPDYFRLVGLSEKYLHIRKIQSNTLFELAVDTPCAIKIDEIPSNLPDFFVRSPVCLGGDYDEVGTTGLLHIAAGKEFGSYYGTWLHVYGTICVDGALDIRTSDCKFDSLTGSGRIEVNNKPAVASIAVASVPNSINKSTYYYLSLDSAIADGSIENLTILDPKAEVPRGYELVTIDGVLRLQKKPFKGLVIIAR